MTHAALTSLLGREFDDFLFAPVGEDRNGLLLSVVSALARLDVDPWREAVSLACMPRERARERLTGRIAALPNDAVVIMRPEEIAARLIALLPQMANRDFLAKDALLRVAATRPSRVFVALSILALLLAAYCAFVAPWSSPRTSANVAATTGEAATPR